MTTDSVIAWFFATFLFWYGIYRGAIAVVEAYEEYKRETSSDIW